MNRVKRFLGVSILGLAAHVAAAQPTYKIIYQPGSAGAENFPPAIGKNGDLYYSDGSAVYRLSPPAVTGGAWKRTSLGVPGGGGGVTIGPSGELYGTNSGNFCGSGSCGSIFVDTPPASRGGAWTQTTLYSFTGGADGRQPWGPLAAAADGSIYGVTAAGGVSGNGTVFQVKPPAVSGGSWTESVLYSFAGPPSDGYLPLGVILGSDGHLYGWSKGGPMVCDGGQDTCGLVFSLSPSSEAGWSETILYMFQNTADGYGPDSLVQAPSGALFGSTSAGGKVKGAGFGGGTAFQHTPPSTSGGAWTKSTLFEFNTASGAHPSGILLGADGNIYGAAWKGGVNCKRQGKFGAYCGTVFELSPPAPPAGTWAVSVIHDFKGGTKDGSQPDSGLSVGPNGKMYGITLYGAGSNRGVVFQVTP